MTDLIERGHQWHMLVLSEQQKETKPLISALTDAVERLNVANDALIEIGHKQADEIESLKDWREKGTLLLKGLTQAEAEIERLRAALSDIGFDATDDAITEYYTDRADNRAWQGTAVEFEIKRLQDCCKEYRAELKQANADLYAAYGIGAKNALKLSKYIQRSEKLEAELKQANAVVEAARNMLDDWDNDHLDVGSVGALEQALAALETEQGESDD